MIGGWIIYTSGASTGVVAQITTVISTTLLTVAQSQTVTAGASFVLYYSTVQLSVQSTKKQRFTGTFNQYVMLPSAPTMTINQSYTITNDSTGTVTVVGAEVGSQTVNNIMPGYSNTYTCISNGPSGYSTGPPTYAVGTASQTTTTITGVGTAFTPSMVGGIIVYANLAIAPITAFVSATSLTSSTSQTEAGQAYTIYYGTSHATGTVSQTGTAVSGSGGTNFTYQMIGGWIVYTSGASTGVVARVTGFTDINDITVTPSQTVAGGTTYTLFFSFPLWDINAPLLGQVAKVTSVFGTSTTPGDSSTNTTNIPQTWLSFGGITPGGYWVISTAGFYTMRITTVNNSSASNIVVGLALGSVFATQMNGQLCIDALGGSGMAWGSFTCDGINPIQIGGRCFQSAVLGTTITITYEITKVI
jgi:hypothetical protein